MSEADIKVPNCAVFEISTVVGPLLGGLITDDFSWRWVFYFNVPIAVVVIAVWVARCPRRAHIPAGPLTIQAF